MNEQEKQLETQLLILGIPSVRGKEKDERTIRRLIDEISNTL